MSSNEDRKLADDPHPRMVNCQKCSAAFDWREEACPECGWEKDEWIENGRYGLGNRTNWS